MLRLTAAARSAWAASGQARPLHMAVAPAAAGPITALQSDQELRHCLALVAEHGLQKMLDNVRAAWEQAQRAEEDARDVAEKKAEFCLQGPKAFCDKWTGMAIAAQQDALHARERAEMLARQFDDRLRHIQEEAATTSDPTGVDPQRLCRAEEMLAEAVPHDLDLPDYSR